MLSKINKTLRAFVIITGAVYVIFKLIGGVRKNDGEGVQTKEYDHIW